MIPVEGDKIIAYGQQTSIIEVIKLGRSYICYIDPSIIVPDKRYSVNHIDSNEIQNYLHN